MPDTIALVKPLGRKAYGSIGHLPNSRLGTGDHSLNAGQARICCQQVRDKHDRIIVQEKLDGSCVSVAKIDGILHPLGRAGWPAISSKYEQHRLFDRWVWANADRFNEILQDGERVCGEWLAQAHGTRYNLPHEPFVPFDIIRGELERMPFDDFCIRVRQGNFTTPQLLHKGPAPISVETALAMLNPVRHGAIDEIEGVVYRVERMGKVDFLAKYVRKDKIDGCYLPEVSGQDAVWNWRPASSDQPTITTTNSGQ